MSCKLFTILILILLLCLLAFKTKNKPIITDSLSTVCKYRKGFQWLHEERSVNTLSTRPAKSNPTFPSPKTHFFSPSIKYVIFTDSLINQQLLHLSRHHKPKTNTKIKPMPPSTSNYFVSKNKTNLPTENRTVYFPLF